MAATTVDDALTDDLGDPPEAPDTSPVGLVVCDYVDPVTHEVCGASFPSRAKLNGHYQGKHRDRSGDAKRGQAEPKADAKPSREAGRKAQAPTSTSASPANRTQVYEASIAMLALGAHIAVPGFDDFDLQCLTRGAPGLANALDRVGEKHQGVRQACDLILGGGGGGDYVQLLLAVLAIGAPIAAHHGWLPPAVGERFGAMIGVMAPPPPVSSVANVPVPDADETGPVRGFDPANATPDDVIAFMSGVPETVMFDAVGRMMQTGGPISVGVPGTPAFDIPDDRGPSRVAPESVPQEAGASS